MSTRSTSLAEHLENYNVENTALHRKLQTNVEAIRILRKELDKYRTERDQFKLMAETIQLRYAAMKTSLYNPETDPYLDSTSATKLLNDMREKNMKLATELEKTKEKLQEKEGDIEALRQEKRDLVAKLEEPDKGGPALEEAERQSFLGQLEALKRTVAQLKFDMQSMVDDKNDLFVEKEAYKAKAKQLQEEAAARSNMMEVDKLLTENNQLKDRMRSMEKDLEMSREIILKYKKFVEAHRQDLGRTNADKDNTESTNNKNDV